MCGLGLLLTAASAGALLFRYTHYVEVLIAKMLAEAARSVGFVVEDASLRAAAPGLRVARCRPLGPRTRRVRFNSAWCSVGFGGVRAIFAAGSSPGALLGEWLGTGEAAAARFLKRSAAHRVELRVAVAP